MEGNSKSPRLLDQLRTRIRFLHYSRSTEQAYVHWTRRYVLFHGKRHPRDLTEEHVWGNRGQYTQIVSEPNSCASVPTILPPTAFSPARRDHDCRAAR